MNMSVNSTFQSPLKNIWEQDILFFSAHFIYIQKHLLLFTTVLLCCGWPWPSLTSYKCIRILLTGSGDVLFWLNYLTFLCLATLVKDACHCPSGYPKHISRLHNRELSNNHDGREERCEAVKTLLYNCCITLLIVARSRPKLRRAE